MSHYAENADEQGESQPEPWLTTLTGTVTTTRSKTSKRSVKDTTTKRQAERQDSAQDLMRRYKIKSETHKGRRVLVLPYNVDPEGVRQVYEAIARESNL